MTTYYRITDGATRDLTPEQYALLQANGKAGDLRVYVVDPQPVLTASQTIDRSEVVVGPVEAHLTWIVRDKTADELAADATQAERTTDLATIRAAMDALRNGTGTAAERLQRCERALVWLFRHTVL